MAYRLSALAEGNLEVTLKLEIEEMEVASATVRNKHCKQSLGFSLATKQRTAN